MNGRLYDPAVGRFLSADPMVQDAGNSQSYNRYSYCLNNPLKYTDPSSYTQAQMWTNEMTESMSAALGAWATALGYTVSNGIGSSSGDGFVGSESSTPRLDREKSTEALDVVGSLLNNPDGGYWSHSTGLVYFESNVSAVVFSGSTRNHYEILRGIQFKDGSDVYFGDEPSVSGSHDGMDYMNAFVGAVGTYFGLIGNMFHNELYWVQKNGTLRSTQNSQ